jgi:hypothetical protein
LVSQLTGPSPVSWETSCLGVIGADAAPDRRRHSDPTTDRQYLQR